MKTALNRRDFLRLTGVVGALVASSRSLISLAEEGGHGPHPSPIAQEDPGYNFVVNHKQYPFQDEATGEWLFHEKIRHTPFPNLKRTPRTTPVDLLLQQPPRVESVDGVLDFDLDVHFADVEINGQIVKLRAYNGAFPSATLVARPGDVLRVREINNLPPNPAGEMHTNVNHPHGFNDINFHTHGLHVSPEDNEDNVLIVVGPGQTFEHEVHIPENHPTGTYWYHPHKHGATSNQVGSGMAGLILIVDPENDIRSIPEIGAAQEVSLIFQEIYIQDGPDGTGEVPGMPISVPDFFYGDRIRYEQTVNGVACNEIGMDGTVVIPELRMRPGEVQHWRMSHAGIFQNWEMSIDEHQMHVVALDGITSDAVESLDKFLFVSGQRRDVMVQASQTPGTYAVRRSAYKQASEVNTWDEQILFHIVVEGEPVEMALPTRLNPPTDVLPYITDDEIVARRTVPFNFIDNTEAGIFLYTIDGKVFKPGRVDFSMVLGTAEEWTITNNPASDHPFHFHVNWFQVMKEIDSAGNEIVYDPPRWMDTANIPAGGSIVVRHRFEDFQGMAVFHCHLLSHEDEGMMSVIEFIDGSPVSTTVGSSGGTLLSNDYQHRIETRLLPGAVSADTELTYQYQSSPNVPTVNPAPALPAEMADFMRFFSLTAEQDGQALEMLNRAATIEIEYSEAQVDTYVIPSTIGLYRYDDEAGVWTTEGISLISRTADILTCSTKHLGSFAVSGIQTVCLDFEKPDGIGVEDLTPILANRSSSHPYFIAPYDVAPVGAPDGVLDEQDMMEVINNYGAYCPK